MPIPLAWVDQNLHSHGLIQVFSRTNRILNSVKSYGNILSFRHLEETINDALAIFGNKEARGIVLLKPYSDSYAEHQQRVWINWQRSSIALSAWRDGAPSTQGDQGPCPDATSLFGLQDTGQ